MKSQSAICRGFFGICCTLLLCACEQKNYSVEIQDGAIHIQMHCPSIGIVGVNQVSYDGFTYEEVEQEVFDKIRNSSFNGNYFIYVKLQFKDSYGNYYDGESKLVTTLNGADVKRYASYSYFRGKTHISDAFPWNQKKQCTHCTNGKIEKYKEIKIKEECPSCRGVGKAPGIIGSGSDAQTVMLLCTKCFGNMTVEVTENKLITENCQYCNGTGYTTN